MNDLDFMEGLFAALFTLEVLLLSVLVLGWLGWVFGLMKE